jgi:hypothetical protein
MSDPDRPEEMQERLDDLGDQIDEARRHAEQDDLLTDPNEEDYYEGQQDQPEIQPPG